MHPSAVLVRAVTAFASVSMHNVKRGRRFYSDTCTEQYRSLANTTLMCLSQQMPLLFKVLSASHFITWDMK